MTTRITTTTLSSNNNSNGARIINNNTNALKHIRELIRIKQAGLCWHCQEKIDAPPPKTTANATITNHQSMILVSLLEGTVPGGWLARCFRTSSSEHFPRLIPKRVHSSVKLFELLLFSCAAAEKFTEIRGIVARITKKMLNRESTTKKGI